jgi:hypothetical protein
MLNTIGGRESPVLGYVRSITIHVARLAGRIEQLQLSRAIKSEYGILTPSPDLGAYRR